MNTIDNSFAHQREQMVENQIEWRGITDLLVLDAMRAVPRHIFVPTEHQDAAYGDYPLSIGDGQTISQPYIVALMTELLNLCGTEKVLEIGTGSGYQAAILGHIAQEVHTIERHHQLSTQAQKCVQVTGLTNVFFHEGDGTLGLPENAPFDAIMITASAPEVPQPLLAQLEDGGILVLPIGSRFNQMLETWVKDGENYKRKKITPVAFVPLIGKHGW